MNLSSHILTSMQANTEKFDDTLVILGPKRKCNLLQKRMSSRQPWRNYKIGSSFSKSSRAKTKTKRGHNNKNKSFKFKMSNTNDNTLGKSFVNLRISSNNNQPSFYGSNTLINTWVVKSLNNPITQRRKVDESSDFVDITSKLDTDEQNINTPHATAKTYSINRSPKRRATDVNQNNDTLLFQHFKFNDFETEPFVDDNHKLSKKSASKTHKPKRTPSAVIQDPYSTSNQFKYTGPSLIGLKCLEMTTAKLTQGHDFRLESTHVDDLDDESQTVDKPRVIARQAPIIVKFASSPNKRVFSAKPTMLRSKNKNRNKSKRSSQYKPNISDSNEFSLVTKSVDDNIPMTNTRIIVNNQINRTRNLAYKPVYRCISAENTSKTYNRNFKIRGSVKRNSYLNIMNNDNIKKTFKTTK